MSIEESINFSIHTTRAKIDLLTESVKDNAEKIADILYHGKDVEIRKSKTGISIAEISKKVVKR